MKIGLMADVRGSVAPLRTALGILAEEGCSRVACLGSTVEGGPDDDAVLAALREADALVLPSPHDAPDEVRALPTEVSAGGLHLAHATPEDMAPDDLLWLTSWNVPSTLRSDALRAAGLRRACGDIYAPYLLLAPDGEPARRRVFLAPETVVVPEGSFLVCPGSVALAPTVRRAPSVMTWDDASSSLTVIPFDESGRRARQAPLLRLLTYSEEFAAQRPDEAFLTDVDLQVRANADDIVADVAREQPDLVLLDYHLAGKLSGLEAILALRAGREALPVPVFSITGNPADSEGMRAAGAAWGLPYTWLRDALTRLVREATGT